MLGALRFLSAGSDCLVSSVSGVGGGSEQDVLLVRGIWVIGVVWIPGTGKKVALPRDGATLNVHVIHKTMVNVGRSPVAAPDQTAAMCQLSEEREITFPRRFTSCNPNDVTRQAIVMHAYRSQFCGAVVEELLLTRLTAISFECHD